jgi:hypothetical protein
MVEQLDAVLRWRGYSVCVGLGHDGSHFLLCLSKGVCQDDELSHDSRDCEFECFSGCF